MFEDIMPDEDDEKQMILYICENADLCDSIHCLHKEPHGKTELGRPEQPESEEPCDCSQILCKYQLGTVTCKPI